MASRISSTIRGKILSRFIPLVAIAMAIMAAFNLYKLQQSFDERYQRSRARVENDIRQQMLLIDAGYQMLESAVEQKLRLASVIFLEAYQQADGKPENIDLDALSQRFRERFGEDFVTYIVDQDAIIRYSSDSAAINFDFAKFGLDSTMKAIIAQDEIKFERIRLNTINGSLGMWSYMPTPDHRYILELGYENKELRGLVESMDMLRIVDELEKVSPFVKEVRIFDAFGDELKPVGASGSSPQQLNRALVQRAFAEKRFVETNEAGNEVITFLVNLAEVKPGLSDPSKIIQITFDKALIQEQFRRELLLNSLLIIAGLALVIYLVYVIGTQISKPIEKLNTVTQEIIEQENYRRKVNLQTNDETEKLANSFTQLMAQVQVGMETLEQRVKERTTQLSETLEEMNQLNEELQANIEKVSHQKNEIARRNRSIQSSINYAKRIQDAMLPYPKRMDDTFGEGQYFVLFRPKDIVSGDFYWVQKLEDGRFIFIVADCTGHGVPGGFMSVIGDSLITQIVLEKKITAPDEILVQLDRSVNKALEQDSTQNRDGMDISACLFDPEKRVLECASAMNAIHLLGDSGAFEKIPPDRLSIGGEHRTEVKFTRHTIVMEEPTNVYLSSDGYRDQFGGPRGRKFMAHNFRKTLQQLKGVPMPEQRKILREKLDNWMAESNERQIDDITVMGVRL